MNRPKPGALTFALALLLAAAAPWHPVSAQSPNAFRITGVEIEAAGSSPDAARERAMSDGRLVAMRQMLRRLTLPEDHDRLPEVPADEVDVYIDGSQIEDEQIAPTRYRARVTYIFDAQQVRGLLRTTGIPFVEVASRPVLVLPITVTDGRIVLWDEPNPWRTAWTRRDVEGGLVPFVDPSGDLEDLQTISGEQALSGNSRALRVIAGRYDAGYVLIAALEPAEAGRYVNLTRYNVLTGQVEELESMRAGEGQEALQEAANELARRLEERWKRNNLVASGEIRTLLVRIPVENYGYWVRLRRNLGMVSLVRETRVVKLTPREARMEIDYVGQIDQLKLALSQSGLVLTEAASNPSGFGDPNRDTGDDGRESDRDNMEQFIERADERGGGDASANGRETRPGQGRSGVGTTEGSPGRSVVIESRPGWTLTLGATGGQTR